MHINNCHINSMIPKWMIVFGSSYILVITFSFLSFIWDAIYNFGKKPEDRRYLNIFDILMWLINVFTFAWLIAGSVWVLGFYRIWHYAGGQDCLTYPGNPSCCERSVFLFSFVVIIFEWIAILLGLLVYLISVICGLCCLSLLAAIGASSYKNLPGE